MRIICWPAFENFLWIPGRFNFLTLKKSTKNGEIEKFLRRNLVHGTSGVEMAAGKFEFFVRKVKMINETMRFRSLSRGCFLENYQIRTEPESI